MQKFSNAEKAQELRRELGMRRHVYPKRVADGKMQQAAADRLLALTQEMIADYERLAAIDTPDMFAEPVIASAERGRYEPRKEMQRRPDPDPVIADARGSFSDPTFGKTPGRNIERGAAFMDCKCGAKVLKGLVRDVSTGTLNTRFWDAKPLTHTDGQNYYTKHRCD